MSFPNLNACDKPVFANCIYPGNLLWMFPELKVSPNPKFYIDRHGGFPQFIPLEASKL